MPARSLFRHQEHEPTRVKKLNDLAERPVQISFVGKPDANQLLWRAIAPRPLYIKAVEADSDTAATGSASFLLKADGVTAAQADWAAGQTVATATIPEPDVEDNSVLQLYAPSSQDATLADGTILITFGEGM